MGQTSLRLRSWSLVQYLDAVARSRLGARVSGGVPGVALLHPNAIGARWPPFSLRQIAYPAH